MFGNHPRVERWRRSIMMQEALEDDLTEVCKNHWDLSKLGLEDRPPNFTRSVKSSDLDDYQSILETMTQQDESEADWKSARLSSSDETIVSGAVSFEEDARLKQLEEEQERLNNSLFSLSTHFAQVQLRLKQIAEAEGEDKEKLLQELQHYAFKGCADTNALKRLRSQSSSDEEVMAKQKERQNELIIQLREQLEELEKLAYESGEGDLPSTVMIQKQKAVLDKLHEKMQLNIEFEKMSPEDIQKQVDNALKELVNPFKAKEQLVEQLQTQIVDLERFVSFLQAENESASIEMPKGFGGSPDKMPGKRGIFGFATSFAARNTGFQKNQLKQTPKGRHYGDERARLQLAVDSVMEVLSKYTLLSVDSIEEEDTQSLDASETLDDDVFDRSEEEVVTAIRKQLCPSLKALLEHGMHSMAQPTASSTSAIGCFAARTQTTSRKAKPLNHIWDVILFFYDSKSGRELSDAPVRKLSQSFKLDNVAGKSVTSKQMLLSAIETIVASHARLKRSSDAQWKAFVSAALNQKKLPAWIRIIFRTRQVIEACYHSWSYVSRTGCEELYDLLESLQKYQINLPVDLALRPFEQMKDAF